MEAEAVVKILAGVRTGQIELISSTALVDEVRRNPSMERRLSVSALLTLASETFEIDRSVERRALTLVAVGYGVYDALHLAAAECSGADALLSTDDRFVRKVERRVGHPGIPVQNPVSWIQEHGL